MADHGGSLWLERVRGGQRQIDTMLDEREREREREREALIDISFKIARDIIHREHRRLLA